MVAVVVVWVEGSLDGQEQLGVPLQNGGHLSLYGLQVCAIGGAQVCIVAISLGPNQGSPLIPL